MGSPIEGKVDQPRSAPALVSVVVPVLNEAADLEDQLAAGRDKVRQAISLHVARETGAYRSFDRGIEPARLWYEDDIEHHYADAARAVLETVGVE